MRNILLTKNLTYFLNSLSFWKTTFENFFFTWCTSEVFPVTAPSQKFNMKIPAIWNTVKIKQASLEVSFFITKMLFWFWYFLSAVKFLWLTISFYVSCHKLLSFQCRGILLHKRVEWRQKHVRRFHDKLFEKTLRYKKCKKAIKK